MKKIIFILVVGLSSCIGVDIVDDFIGSKLIITNTIDTLYLGSQHEFSYRFTNSIGEIVEIVPAWHVSDDQVASIDGNGTVTPHSQGVASVGISYLDGDELLVDTTSFFVSEGEIPIDMPSTSRTGLIATTSSYLLEGDFSFTNIEGGIRIDVGANYKASTALPELVVFITNNPNTINPDVSLEVASVSVFEGAHSYDVMSEGLDVNTYDYILYYCKPFAVKVGDGELE